MSQADITEAKLKHFVSSPQFDETIVLKKDPEWPRISVVTPSYNQGRYLEQTILSVLNQNYPNLEFIIMDGGSTDNSVGIIQKYEKYLAHWKSSRDDGQAAAIAAGFRVASGEILAYLNSDDVYLPGALRKVGKFFFERRTAQFMYGDCLIIDSNNTVLRRIYPSKFDLQIFLYENPIIPQPAAFWRQSLYKRVGGITQTLQFCMDYDLFMRFAMAGESLVGVKDILSAFRSHGDSKSSLLQSRQREEYRKIFEEVTGRSFRKIDLLKIAYCRLRRYYLNPQALLERVKACLLRTCSQ
jgi:glycosyltransferase involved in cell wall biosynthesis